MRLRVSRVVTRNWKDKHNWKIEQPRPCGAVRMFIYERHWQAIQNAQRLARGQMVSTYGLRCFEIKRGV